MFPTWLRYHSDATRRKSFSLSPLIRFDSRCEIYVVIKISSTIFSCARARMCVRMCLIDISI